MSTVSEQGIKALAQIKEGLTSGNWGFVDVDDWLIRASIVNGCTPKEIVDRLLAPQDIEDLKTGQIEYEVFKGYVKIWCDMGKPKQNQIYDDVKNVTMAQNS